ncbi:type II toxin-antitoxin system PemK/MazF family toxin [Methylobacter sp. S3L5C]|uniref:type II toxin-antitoxin system PemK/MazF family toxin n=1 Tax=Methylobacter sp. S3L5C TaxID=2839024 RepID=UPI001FABED35|nr:type II toxin-antitoxin system PemK/MazF family toxin [Methylobacter sp. S3L5C]UOA08776.1 type II toxin-antitoxin system PemK/MazF family toxin [Methylobacter sp. S3L5C]
MRRGDLVTIVLQGAYGKPRPALIIQSDLFSEHPSVTIIPITSELRDTPLFRVPVRYGESTGLRKPSEIMIDKVQTIPREKIGAVFGRLAEEDMLAVNRALAVFLGVV